MGFGRCVVGRLLDLPGFSRRRAARVRRVGFGRVGLLRLAAPDMMKSAAVATQVVELRAPEPGPLTIH